MADSRGLEPDLRTLERLKSGDVAALGSVFELFGLRVHRLATRMMGNEADAEDVTQDIFLRVYERARDFAGQSRFSTWLYRVSMHCCLNRIKQRRRRTVAEGAAAVHRTGSGSSAGESAANRLELQDEVARADALLATLSPAYRACIVLREVEQLSYARIAEILELPVGTVMSRLARGRALLSRDLAAFEKSGE